MIRVRLTRRRRDATRVIRARPSGETPAEQPLVIEGLLVVVKRDEHGQLATAPARSYEEGINYDEPLALLLDQPADDGGPRIFRASLARLITTSGWPEYVPLSVETGSSEYMVMVLQAP